MITGRPLRREEIGRVWSIDRSEVIERIYRISAGDLVLKSERYDVRGWASEEAESFMPLLIDCFDGGGWVYGLFDGAMLIGAAMLAARPIDRGGNRLQLLFLHLSRAYRKRGLGRRLFDLAKAEARARGAQGLYVSATPSQNTVDFYRRLGCRLTGEPDPELLAREPDDIHLICDL